jgi:8-oxo-dGTP diphosphatase
MTQIHVGVQAVVTARRDRTALLLGKRRGVFGDGQWALPGGHLEFGESFEEAVKRELEEEVGIKAAAIEYLSSINTAYTANAPGTHYVQIGMQVMDYKGEPENKEPDRCSELRWFSLDEPMPKPIFAPSQPFVDLMHRRRQASKEARSSRLSIYMHRIDIKLNMDKYVSYDLLADVPMLIVRFGRSNEANSRQLRVYTPRSFDQGLDFLRKEISKRLAHHYRLSDITGSLSIDLASVCQLGGCIARFLEGYGHFFGTAAGIKQPWISIR